MLAPRRATGEVGARLRGAGDHAHHLWTLLMLELWFREFIDRAPAQAVERTA